MNCFKELLEYRNKSNKLSQKLFEDLNNFQVKYDLLDDNIYIMDDTTLFYSGIIQVECMGLDSLIIHFNLYHKLFMEVFDLFLCRVKIGSTLFNNGKYSKTYHLGYTYNGNKSFHNISDFHIKELIKKEKEMI